MSSTRAIAAAGGALYLLTFVTSIPALALKQSFLDGGEPGPAVALAAVLEILLAIACLGTAVVLLPVLRRHGEIGAFGFLASRGLEAAIIMADVVALLSLSTVRGAGVPIDDPAVAALTALHDWAFLIGPGLMAPINALCLGSVLYRSGLVPRAIPLIGLIGAPIQLVSVVLSILGVYGQVSTFASIAALPIAVWEFSLGVRLLGWGFRRDALERGAVAA